MVAWRLRSDFERIRAGLLQTAYREGWSGPRRSLEWLSDDAAARWRRLGRGRFSERLITLTVPDPDLGGVRDRIRVVRDAFARFAQSYSDWRRAEIRGLDGPEAELRTGYWAALEWTPGADGLGHPHWHLWNFGPFLPKDLAAGWWRDAVAETLGRDVGPCFVDVRTVHGGQVADERGEQTSVARELVKYLTKDWIAKGKRVPPETLALVFAELWGKRARRSSSGIRKMMVERIHVCPCCDHEAPLVAYWQTPAEDRAPLAALPVATGPPLREPIDWRADGALYYARHGIDLRLLRLAMRREGLCERTTGSQKPSKPSAAQLSLALLTT